jgi:spore coat protein U-like protein
MGGYYGQGYATVYTPGYQVEDRFATVESNLYDAASEKLVWTTTSDTWMSEGNQKLVKTFVAIMVESLRKQKIVP